VSCTNGQVCVGGHKLIGIYLFITQLIQKLIPIPNLTQLLVTWIKLSH
jgi:hypothetical protein